MNKAYIIWPLAGLLVFGGFYWNFIRTYSEKQRQEEVGRQEERKARIIRETEIRRKAILEAITAQEKRMADRAAKEKREEEEKAARTALIDHRNRVFDEVNKRLRPQVDRLKSDADDVKEQIAKAELEGKQYIEEETFLRSLVTKAESNVKEYYALLDQLTAAEKARADAAKAAAAAAKKS
jgi:hypothetical protein